MADYVFPDGTEVTFDFDKITQREFLALVDPKQSIEADNAVIARVAGVSPDKFLDLPRREFKKFIRAFYAADRGTSDPN